MQRKRYPRILLVRVRYLQRCFCNYFLFDSGAVEKAKNAHHKIILIDGIKLVDLINEFNVGVQQLFMK